MVRGRKGGNGYCVDGVVGGTAIFFRPAARIDTSPSTRVTEMSPRLEKRETRTIRSVGLRITPSEMFPPATTRRSWETISSPVREIKPGDTTD